MDLIPAERFIKPTIEEIKSYCLERNNGVDPQKFFDFYESKGWMIGKNHMKDWRATMRGWSAREKNEAPKPAPQRTPAPNNNKFHNFEQRKDDLDALLQNGRVFRGANV